MPKHPPCSAARRRTRRLARCTTAPTTSSTAAAARRGRKTRPPARWRLRPQQARRRGSDPRQRLPPSHLAHQLGLRSARRQLRQDDAAPGEGARPALGDRRPDRRAHRSRPARRPQRALRPRAAARRTAGRHLPRRGRRRNQLARLRDARDRLRAPRRREHPRRARRHRPGADLGLSAARGAAEELAPRHQPSSAPHSASSLPPWQQGVDRMLAEIITP